MAKNGLAKILKIGTLALAIGIGAGCTGCGQTTTVEKKPQIFDIKISEYTFVGGAYIGYCGMNNEKTFSISNPMTYTAVNIYYPVNSKEIHWGEMDLKVLEVTPEHLVLEK